MIVEKYVLNEKRNVTLTAFLQEVGGEFPNITKRPAILVLPGGGYSMCSDREAEPIALTYLQAGYQAFVLRYSVKKDALWPNPLNDYEQAMEMIRGNADKWNLYADKVAVIGFSAGGHLAGAAATLAKNKPNAAILGYPAVEGSTIRFCEATAPDVVAAVDKNTCPCFVFATRTDNIVPISNTLNFTAALAQHGIGFESHIYAYGPHGFSTGNSSVMAPNAKLCQRAPGWVADSIGWLKDVLGDFGNGEMTEPNCRNRVNDDSEPFLSADCTMSKLMSNEHARAILSPMMAAAREKMGGGAPAEDELNEKMVGLAAGMTLRDALTFGSVPAAVIDQLDAALKQIPNV